MKDWKEYAYLFANGKFIMHHKVMDKKLIIIGIHIADKRFLSIGDGLPQMWVDYKDCNLIARPISDMKDKEKKTWQGLCYKRQHEYSEFNTSHHESPKSFIYLLSIGVYPFDQSDFGKTVIDINTL